MLDRQINYSTFTAMKTLKPIQTNLENDYLEKVKKLSKDKGMSLASVVRMIIIEYFTKKK